MFIFLLKKETTMNKGVQVCEHFQQSYVLISFFSFKIRFKCCGLLSFHPESQCFFIGFMFSRETHFFPKSWNFGIFTKIWNFEFQKNTKMSIRIAAWPPRQIKPWSKTVTRSQLLMILLSKNVNPINFDNYFGKRCHTLSNCDEYRLAGSR